VSENINVKCYGDLEALARLRNILVHRYWVIKDDVVYNDVKKNFSCVAEFLNKVKELIA